MNGKPVDQVKLKCDRPRRVRFAHDGKGSEIDGHKRDMWQYSRKFVANEWSRFEGSFELESIGDGVTIWQLHAAGTPLPTMSLVAGRQAQLLQFKWMGYPIVGYELAELPSLCPFCIEIVTHQYTGSIDVQIADLPPLHQVGIPTMMGPAEWHHVGVLSGIDTDDQPEVAVWWQDFALFEPNSPAT